MNDFIFYEKNGDENRVRVPEILNERILYEYLPGRMGGGARDSEYYKNVRGGTMKGFDCWGYKNAECGASVFMHKNLGMPLVLPDFKIYKPSEKSWSPDLVFTNVTFQDKFFETLNIHVKSFTRDSLAKYPESYTFQLCNKNGHGGRDRLLDHGNENDYCMFVFVPYTEITLGKIDVYVRCIVPWTFINDNNLLGDPVLPHLKYQKRCVYTEAVRRKIKQTNS